MTKTEETKEYILKQIREKKWKPGNKIFSKYQFSKYLNISPNTAQSAVHELIRENILESRRGSGVYVRDITEKNKIIISIRESILYFENSKFHRNSVAYLRKKFESLGFVTEINIEKNLTKYDTLHTKETINKTFDFEEIAGFISLFGSRSVINYFAENNIPVIDWNYSEYPSVVFDKVEFHKQIINLTEKYLGEKPVFIEYDFDKTSVLYMDVLYPKIIDKYDFALIPIVDKFKKTTYYIDKYLESIDFKPTGFVFLDDTLYLSALPLFEKYKDIFADSKIITMSNNDEFYPENYKICRIEYTVEEKCDKICELLMRAINKEYIAKPNYSIKGKIINEMLIK